MHIWEKKKKKRGVPLHEAPATVGSKESQVYTALSMCMEWLFPCFVLVTPRSTLLLCQGPPCRWNLLNKNQKYCLAWSCLYIETTNGI